MRYKHFIYDSAIVAAVFVFSYLVLPAQAQETIVFPAATATSAVGVPDVAVEPATPASADEGVAESAEVTLDETISPEDLGAVRARILPDSPWHAFKRMGWGLAEAFTFDPVKDAALKGQHAAQQLSEVKQMIDEKGLNNIAPNVIDAAMTRFAEKIGAVEQAAEGVRGEVSAHPDAVSAFIADAADKHINEQKVLDLLVKQALAVKDAEGTSATRVEAVISKVRETKNSSTANFTKVLGAVETTPAAMTQTLNTAMERQTGSPLRDLKHISILEEMGKAAPATVAAAIEKAKEETIIKFEARVKDVPQAVRGKTFTDYIKHSSGEETKLFQLLDEVQRHADLPSDILEKMEEAKELVVRRFENKVRLIENPEVESDLLGDLTDESADDVIVLEDFRSRTSSDSEARQLVTAEHDRAVTAFKTRFNDSKSEEQAEMFRNLSQEMIAKPSAKTFKFLKDLETEVRSDPSKSTFLDELNKEMQTRVEDQYRREGDKFVTRFVSLDPDDFEIMKTINFSQVLKDQTVKKKTEKMKEYVRDMTEPADFDRFYGRFVDAPKAVIEDIKVADPDFQQAMQFKWRKMEEERLAKERERQTGRLKVDYAERELRFQTDRVEQKKQDEFFQKLQDIPWDDFDARKNVWEEKINDSAARLDEKYTEQKRLFEERLKVDPFGCDDICQQAQLQFLEQEQRHARERLSDELARERNRVEAEKVRQQRNNPLAGKCKTPTECETFCRANRGLPECNWLPPEPVLPKCAPGTAWDPTERSCVATVDVATACSAGFYWNGTTCVADPFYRPPENLRRCPYGSHWNDMRGSCEADLRLRCEPVYGADGAVFYSPECERPDDHYCPSGRVWDMARRDCVDPAAKQCGDGYFFDYVTRRCESKTTPVCQEWQHWDPASRGCVQNDVICPAVMPIPCPPGEHNESYTNPQGCNMPGKCVPDDITKPQCPTTLYNDYTGGTQCGVKACDNGCFYSSNGCPVSCRPKPTQRCDDYRTPAECATNKICDWFDKSRGSYGCKIRDFAGACGDNYCSPSESSATCPMDCGQNLTSQCGNAICEATETVATCPADCTPPPVPVPVATTTRPAFVCGDGQCNGAETSATCAADCGPVVDPLCNSSPYYCTTRESCLGRGSFWCGNNCQSGSCSGGANCGNGICDPTESATTCATDCSSSTNQCATTPPLCTNQSQCVTNNFFWCNGACFRTQCSATACNKNGVCDVNETPASCATDCQGLSNTYCGAGWNYDTAARSCVRAGITCSTPTVCDSCRGAATTAWCQWNNDGCPVSCQRSATGFCGDRTCNNSETVISCPGDCGGFTCNNNRVCDAGETPATCAADCTPVNVTCNNNGICDSSETVALCPGDCGTSGTHYCPPLWTWNSASGSCVQNGVTCSNYSACSVCPPGASSPSGLWCTFENNGCPSGCSGGTTVTTSTGGGSASVCGDRICNGSEAPISCPADCGTSTTETCGNGFCGSGETSVSCPRDCTAGSTSCSNSPSNCYSRSACESYSYTWCDSTSLCYTRASAPCGSDTIITCNRNWVCDNGETNATCPSDCNTSGGTATCDGDGTCETNESAASCPADCSAGVTNICNNNGVCDNGETIALCPADCGSGSSACSASPSGCYSRSACETYNYMWCDTTNLCYPLASAPCNPASTVSCNNNGVCDGYESAALCPSDCGSGGSMTACNSNGTCDSGESSGSCSNDCGGATGGCATTPYSCSSQSDCTSHGFYWCNNACYGSSSACSSSTTYAPNAGNRRLAEAPPLYRLARGFGAFVASIFKLVARASAGL